MRDPERRLTSVLAWALGLLLLVTGADHFLSPSGFEAIVPRALGSPAFWLYASGVAELLVAVGLIVRRIAAIAAVVRCRLPGLTRVVSTQRGRSPRACHPVPL